MNAVINQIIVEVQGTLMTQAPEWNTREEYANYQAFEQNVAEAIRELTAALEAAAKSGADKATIKRLALQIIASW